MTFFHNDVTMVMVALTLTAAIALMGVVAGPLTYRPLIERFCVWVIAIGMVLNAVADLGEIYFTHNEEIGTTLFLIGAVSAMLTRVAVISIGVYAVYQFNLCKQRQKARKCERRELCHAARVCPTNPC